VLDDVEHRGKQLIDVWIKLEAMLDFLLKMSRLQMNLVNAWVAGCVWGSSPSG
jgi:hypothetical protein